MRGQKRIFTDEEKQYIVDNWGCETVKSLRNRFGCSWYAINAVVQEFGLDKLANEPWTEEEENNLRELSEKYHYEEIARILNRSSNAICLKARKLGITLIKARRKWTEEEEEILQDLWGNKPVEFIARKLKRTVNSLKVKAVRMGLGPMIRNNYDFITISELGELLGVCWDRVMNTWFKLGLNIKRVKVSSNCFYYGVKWEDLMIFLEQNQNEWDSRNVDANMLGPEPDWLIEKRARDKIENPLWYRRWTEEEIEKAIELFKSGKNYEEIAAVIDRTKGAVAYALNNAGYSYMLPQFWRGSELKYLRENYQTCLYVDIAEHLGRSEKAVGAKAEELGYIKRRTREKENG